MGRKYGFSFSWKRALGLSAAKAKLSRRLGIPLTRAGRQRKVGRALGCLVSVLTWSVFSVACVLGIMLLWVNA